MAAYSSPVFLPELQHDSSLLVTAPLASGETMSSIFSVLYCDACICLASSRDLLEKPCTVINHFQVSHLFTTPTFLSRLSPTEALSSMDVVTLSGENLQQSTIELWRSRVRLITAYGADRVGTTCITHDHSRSSQKLSAALIGRPTSNVVAYVLDKYMQPVPVGAIGKLYLGTHFGQPKGHLSQDMGYRHMSIEDPFREGHLVYHTGDTAHFLADGAIWLHGSCDEQLILGGGHLYELREVEAALLEAVSVERVAVVVHHGLITAFVTPASVDVNQFIVQCENHLPRYLWPSRIVAVEDLPMTMRWQLDRTALLAMVKEYTTVDE